MKILRLLAILLACSATVRAEVTTAPPGGGSGFACTALSCTFTAPLLAPAANNCSAPPYSFTGDTDTGACSESVGTWEVFTDGNRTLTARSASSLIQLYYSLQVGATATDDPIKISVVAKGVATHTGTITSADLLSVARTWTFPDDDGTVALYTAGSKIFVDASATAFVRLTVADDDYEGCHVVWTAFAEDADTDARQTRTGAFHVAILNNSGTEAAVFSTGDSAVAVTAGTLTCAFDGNSAVADTIDLRANCDTSLDAAAETKTFEWRIDCVSPVTTITAQ